MKARRSSARNSKHPEHRGSPRTPAPDASGPEHRTVALVGHRSAGKTSLAEMLLQAARVVREPGAVDQGTTLLDWTPAERRLHQTIELSTAWFEWNGPVLQLVDTPGASFLADARDLALEVVETAVVVVDTAAGVEIGAEDALRTAARLDLPTVVVLTKADRGPSPDGLVESLSRAAGVRAVPVQLPFHDEDGRLIGVIDLLQERALRFADDGAGTWSPEPIPLRLQGEVAAAREQLAEAVAVTDDLLLERYLEYLELPPEVVRDGLVAAVRARQVVPILVTSAQARVGAGPLLDHLVEWVPPLAAFPREGLDADGARRRVDPDGPFVARVLSEHVDPDGERFHLIRVLAGRPPRGDWFDGRTGAAHRIRKTYRLRGPRRQALSDVAPGAIVATWDVLPVPAGTTLTDGPRLELVTRPPRPPMMSLAVRPERARDQARLDEGLRALLRADRGLALRTNEVTGDLLLAGADESHLKISLERLEAWTGVRVRAELPPVGYVETPAAAIEGVAGVHVREDNDGLVEEYGRCELAVAPLDPTEGTSFEDAIGEDDEDLPRKYRPAVTEGAEQALKHGPLAGYPVVGVRLVLTGGAYDMLQSTDEHFKLAGERAVKTALERAGTRLLEPWCDVEIVAPQQAVGDLLSDIAAHRGRVVGMQVDGDDARISASYPYRELRTFAPRLQALTGGRGRYEPRGTTYEPVPGWLVDEAVRSSPRAEVSGRGGGGRVRLTSSHVNRPATHGSTKG